MVVRHWVCIYEAAADIFTSRRYAPKVWPARRPNQMSAGLASRLPCSSYGRSLTDQIDRIHYSVGDAAVQARIRLTQRGALVINCRPPVQVVENLRHIAVQ